MISFDQRLITQGAKPASLEGGKDMKFKTGALCTVAMVASLAASSAFAQEMSEAEDQGVVASEVEAESVLRSKVIVVTAQRREQSLSEVPVSVSAFNADVLQDRNVTSEQDLASLVPGLIVKSGQNSNQLSFTLRGQTLDPFSGSSPAVLTYLNEAPFTAGNTSTAFFDFS